MNGGLKEVYKRFSPYYKDYKKQISLAILGMIMVSIGTSLSAWLVEPTLNKIFIQKNENLLYILPFFIILIYAIKGGGSYMQTYFTVYVGRDIIKRFRNLMVSKILIQDMQFFSEYRTGELISRTINDIERIRSIVSNMIPDFITQSVTIFGLLCVIVYQSPMLSFFALIVIPVAFIPLSKLAKKMKKISKESQKKISDISSALSEIYTNIEIIKINNCEKKESQRFAQENQHFFDINMKATRISELTSPLMETLGSIGIAVVIIIGGKEVIAGNLDVGKFFSFLTALFMLYTPVKRLSNIYNKMQDAIAASERTFELMDTEPKIKGGEKEFKEMIQNVTFDNVHLSYENKKALNGINFSVKKGEILALVGNSGGGKTSIINLLMRFYNPNEGKILINNKNINKFDLKSLRENISLVSQRVYIFNDTIANNVAYSDEFDEKRVIEALKMANAYEFVLKLENGIYTTLNEFGTNLSGGQRQRIAIARALYKNPQILILDEATSALDNASEQEITNIIEKIKKDKIIFVIAHRLSTIKNATNIVVVNEGEVVGFGNDENLSKNCEIYRILKGEISKNK